ncbi:MAG: zinc ABC transporter substrate-binding protein [Candidatus Sumerlaeia bacterium]|nr:zinc ABC transporter substrate-binding protein [Candidatus Sumerlaeia bacterium]
MAKFMMTHRTLPFLLLFLPLLFLGCSSATNSSSSESDDSSSLRIVATTGMLGDVAREVFPEGIQITTLMRPGVDPHTYVPTREDTLALTEAQVILYNGLHLEGRMGDILERMEAGRKVYRASDYVQADLILSTGAENSGDRVEDPHLWTDVALWAGMVEKLSTQWASDFPESAEVIRENSREYVARLRALHGWGLERFETIPQTQRILVTAHDAFGYFGRAYGLEVHGVQGISTESEAGLSDLNALVDLIVERRIPSIFVESSVSPKNIQALREGATARGHEVVLGGEMYSDAMGAEGTYEGTYLGMMDHNLTLVVRSLGGDAPVDGFQGLLGKDTIQK